METTATVTVSAALRGAALKREKKAAAVLARIAGKAAAAERREAEEAAWLEIRRQGREKIEKKTGELRKAMGVRKNEANPASICSMISQWECELNLQLYAARPV